MMQDFNLEAKTNRVLELKNNIGEQLIELGQELKSVMDNIPRKEYLDWLKFDVKIHRATAHRYMMVAAKVDAKTLSKVGSSKVYEILEAPISDEEKISLLGRAEQMSTKEIQTIVHAPTEQPEEIARDFPPEFDEALNLGMDLVERIDDLDPHMLTPNWKKFMKSQLTMVVGQINSFISKL